MEIFNNAYEEGCSNSDILFCVQTQKGRYEDLKDYDKSFKYLNEANKIQKKKLIIILKMTKISLIIFKVYLVN